MFAEFFWKIVAKCELFHKIKKMWDMNVYRVFYGAVHVIYTILESIYGATIYLYGKLVFLFHQELLPSFHKGRYSSSDFNKLAKRPKHITVLLGLEEPVIKDLANLILWCMATQVCFISFYDFKGDLKKHEEDLQYEVNLYRPKDNHIVWHNDPKIVHKNGFVGRTTHIKILSNCDGKKSVVNLAKNMASLSRSESDVTICAINKTLLEQYEFPDPDMGIVCGKVFRFFNYPPWQIRLTEFFRIDTFKGLEFSDFFKLLLKFSRCEQRLGK